MNPHPPGYVIDLLSEEDTDGQEDSENSLFESFLNDDVSTLPISTFPGQNPAPYSGRPHTAIPSYETCLAEILEIFPDISREHVRSLYNSLPHQDTYFPTAAQVLIDRILDGGKYPKERDRIRELKRKRSDKNNDEEEAARWKYADLRDNAIEYSKVAKAALHEAFPYVPSKFINEKFKEHGHYYGAFFAILEAQRSIRTAVNPPYPPLRARRANAGKTSAAMMIELTQHGFDFEELKREIDSAQQRRKREADKINATIELEKAQEAQDQEHRARGEVMDCACCFDTVTTVKITHCNGDEPHFFCLDCAKQNASTDIGNSRWALRCMDGSGCAATFSRQERERFLDTKSIEKLERLQQQDEIRLADLPNLCTCPFCDFAAIYPPIEDDKEFRCRNPECEEVSCRLCKAKSHIPLSCDEFKKENGISERRVIEEARTEALIRTCGKCKVRILKEDGCNKVICTKCYAVLCDYCGKDISKQLYNHFDGQGRAPPGVNTDDKTGKCPLYDESHKRKDQQVDKAEKEAMEKVRAEHPDLSEEDLKIKFAKGVQTSNNRHLGVPHPHFGIMAPHHHHHHHHHHHRRHYDPGGRDAALNNREAAAALDYVFEGVDDILEGFGHFAHNAGQQAREREHQAREQMRIHQQELQHQMQYHRENLFRHRERTNQVQLETQRETNHRQEALRGEMVRRLEQARQVGRHEAAQAHRAPAADIGQPTFLPFQNVDVLGPRENNRASLHHPIIQPDIQLGVTRARGHYRHNEGQSRGLGSMADLDPPTQRRENNDFRLHAADRVAEARPRYVDPISLNPLPLPRIPGEYPGVPRRRDPIASRTLNSWASDANDQAYLYD